MKRCSKCLLPETYPRITFNRDGVCNYCLGFSPKQNKSQEELQVLLDHYKRPNYDYDCAVGVSGGRDSSYVAYYTSKVLGMKILAYTVDNGFMTREARMNVRNLKEALGIDHITIEYNFQKKAFPSLFEAWLKRPSAALLGLFCTGCGIGIYNGTAEIARDYKIPFIFQGMGEPQNSNDQVTFQEMLLSVRGIKPKAVSLLAGFGIEMMKNYHFFNPKCLSSIGTEFYYRYMFDINRTIGFISLFDYVVWDENEILTTIKNELNWQKPPKINASWRSDCKIHQLRQYLYSALLGFTKNDEQMSCMIRENMIDREEASKLLALHNTFSRSYLSEFLDKYNFSLKQVDEALERVNAEWLSVSRSGVG